MFNRCPIVDDRLRLREKMMNIHQPIIPNIITIVSNVSILGTQAMNPSIGYITIPINY
jgi:hypothetical protein